MRASNSGKVTAGSNAGISPTGEPTSRQRPRACNWACCHTSSGVFTRAFAMPASSSFATICSAVSSRNVFSINATISARRSFRLKLVS
ncbi:hypothetical protein D3C83_51040 [compost metagenome]